MGMRREFLSRLLDPRRDIRDECGYPKDRVSAHDYATQFDEDPIANRVVSVWPSETWLSDPTVYEMEANRIQTEFEYDWAHVGDNLYEDRNFYASEQGSIVWPMCRAADVQSGIGHYGMLLLGLDDGKELSEPAQFREGQKLMYLRPFPEHLAQITKYDNNKNSRRYGMPTQYLATFNDPRTPAIGIGANLTTQYVHWSRCVHVVDNVRSSNVLSLPRLRTALWRVMDLQKLYGGSAEMYWRGAFPGFVFQSNPQLGLKPRFDADGMKRKIETWVNGLDRFLTLIGFDAKAMSPQVVSPVEQINCQLQAICIFLEMPMRVFLGSEQAQLASEQDHRAWNRRVTNRRNKHATPRILVPLINRLIALGVLRAPKTQYRIAWPDDTYQTEQEKAQTASSKAVALSVYINSQLYQLITPVDYLTRVMYYSRDEAYAIIEAAAKNMGLVGNRATMLEAHTAFHRFVLNEKDRLGHGSEKRGRKAPEPATPPASAAVAADAKAAFEDKQPVDPSRNRPSLPEERVEGATPKVLPWREPPPKKGKKGEGMKERPKGDQSQTKIGDLGEDLSSALGFRDILPEGKRSFTAAEVAEKGSSIDLEYDHSGKLYELKLCNTTATEYRLKAKKEEKDAKMKYAESVGGTAYTMVAVRDADTNEIHFYGSKQPGLTGAEVSEKNFDYFGSVKY